MPSDRDAPGALVNTEAVLDAILGLDDDFDPDDLEDLDGPSEPTDTRADPEHPTAPEAPGWSMSSALAASTAKAFFVTYMADAARGQLVTVDEIVQALDITFDTLADILALPTTAVDLYRMQWRAWAARDAHGLRHVGYVRTTATGGPDCAYLEFDLVSGSAFVPVKVLDGGMYEYLRGGDAPPMLYPRKAPPKSDASDTDASDTDTDT